MKKSSWADKTDFDDLDDFPSLKQSPPRGPIDSPKTGPSHNFTGSLTAGLSGSITKSGPSATSLRPGGGFSGVPGGNKKVTPSAPPWAKKGAVADNFLADEFDD